MKKILFNNRYGLETAVIERRKTMTRREVKLPDGMKPDDVWNPVMGIDENGRVYFTVDCVDGKQRDIYPLYQIGEVVAVGQRYKDVIRIANRDESVWQFLVEKGLMQSGGAIDTRLCTHAGYDNKMFARADFMPHRIRITNIKVERLQDISDDDCMKEGIMQGEFMNTWDTFYFDEWGDHITFKTPHAAFASLIDRINGRGTWQDNPWVVAYTMDLQRAENFKEQETNK